jgi:hypothetical protein
MLMNPETSSELEPQVNKLICEAVGCEQLASEQITVNVGEFGTLILSVCRNCIGKFLDN